MCLSFIWLFLSIKSAQDMSRRLPCTYRSPRIQATGPLLLLESVEVRCFLLLSPSSPVLFEIYGTGMYGLPAASRGAWLHYVLGNGGESLGLCNPRSP